MTHPSTRPPSHDRNSTHDNGADQADAAISHAGYAQQFSRTLKSFESFAVAFSFISITTGLFTTYGTVLNSGGPAGIWTWPIVGAGTVAVALLYGALASRIPLSGYSYQWASRLASPVLGWWFGWVSFAFLAIVAVAVDYGLAQVALFPLFGWEYTPMAGALTTLVVLVVQMVLIIWSTPITTKINNLAVSAEVIAMIGLTLLIAGFAIFGGHAEWSNLTSTGAVSGDGYFGWLGPFMLSALLGAFTLVGWESAANLAEETINPKQVVPRAMVRAILLSVALGMLFLVVVTAALGNDVASITASSAPVAQVVENVLGAGVARAFLVVVSLAIFACGLVIMVSCSRLVHSMARDGRLPFSAALSRVPRATGGPTWATVLAAGASIAIVLAFSGNADALSQLLGAGTLMPALLYAGTVALYLGTRRRHRPRPDDFRLGKWEPLVVAGAVIWLVIELAIFLIPSDFRTAQVYALGSLVLGAVVFAVVWVRGRDRLTRETGDSAELL